MTLVIPMISSGQRCRRYHPYSTDWINRFFDGFSLHHNDDGDCDDDDTWGLQRICESYNWLPWMTASAPVGWRTKSCKMARSGRKKKKVNEWRKKIHMEEFNEDELSVKATEDGRVVVDGKKKVSVETEEGGHETVSMTREFHLPRDVDTKALRVYYSPDGELSLSALYKNSQKSRDNPAIFHVQDKLQKDTNHSNTDDETEQHNDSHEQTVDDTTEKDRVQEVDACCDKDCRKLKLRQDSGTVVVPDHDVIVNFDLSGFSPEDVKVKVKDDRLIVHGRHEDKDGDMSCYREIYRETTLPDDVDLTSLKSKMTEDGMLHITRGRGDADNGHSDILITLC